MSTWWSAVSCAIGGHPRYPDVALIFTRHARDRMGRDGIAAVSRRSL
jgi:hypothetical protein